ncbi:TetR family transcriptional regulator [Nesterenkonia sp. CL21]|nr:TetR family transcriptional regulator [Nesterenkonia sp. CL21]MDS2173408.1 TetR family transcriptional regulator [Nesterenkonia sp. CL21]
MVTPSTDSERDGLDPRTAAASHNVTGTGNTSPPAQDTEAAESSGADRILDAAIELFGEHGFSGTSLKAIAQRADVSAPLVIHHFGSKAGLRKACDERVAELFYQFKSESIARSRPALPRNYVMEAIQASGPIIHYLLQAFLAGGDEIDALMDRLVEDSLEYTAEAERIGLIHPSANPRNRAVVMLLQSFGALMLHKQMKRLLGASPLEDSPEDLAPYMSAVLELYTRPVLNAKVYGELARQLRETQPEPTADDTPVDDTPVDHTPSDIDHQP